MKKLILFSCIFLAVSAAGAGSSLINVQAPDFHLSDQYGRPYSLGTFSGRPVVLLASDRGGERENHEWGELIGRKYGSQVRIVGAADLRTVPFFLKGWIRDRFRKDPNPVLLDWDGILFTSLGLAKGAANVVLIDGAGMVRGLQSGKASPGAVERIFSRVDAVLKGR